jgi:tRNA pseudouridine55 synthase
MTSHDVVDLVRRNFRIKKAGHGGTLDPGATGVLVILLGKATKMFNTFMGEEKEYVAHARFGLRTDTGDSDGAIICERVVDASPGDIKDVFAGFVGEIEQLPPMFSAKKVDGKKLYQLARKGITVERKPKKVTISEIEVIEAAPPDAVLRIVCGSGTYIRQLVDDAGEKLGCGAVLTDLRRTRSGRFRIEKALSIESLLKMDRRTLEERARSWVLSLNGDEGI